jgi:microcompartment protein CcmK/EutM
MDDDVTRYVGLDVHDDSIAAAVAERGVLRRGSSARRDRVSPS